MAGDAARRESLVIVVEPLNQSECNVFNKVGECAQFVREVDHPQIRLLVDAYHWAQDQDSVDDLVAAAPLLHHAHIATYQSRLAPSLEPCDFAPFFGALKQGGFDGRISVEGRWNNIATDAAKALEALKQAARGS